MNKLNKEVIIDTLRRTAAFLHRNLTVVLLALATSTLLILFAYVAGVVREGRGVRTADIATQQRQALELTRIHNKQLEQLTMISKSIQTSATQNNAAAQASSQKILAALREVQLNDRALLGYHNISSRGN